VLSVSIAVNKIFSIVSLGDCICMDRCSSTASSMRAKHTDGREETTAAAMGKPNAARSSSH